MPILRRRCLTPDCKGRRWELLSIGTRVTSLDRPDDELDDLTCPGCGGDGEGVIGAALLKGLGGSAGVGKQYPYFDRGLGCHVESATHHAQLMRFDQHGNEREHRLRPLEGTWDPERDMEREADEQRASDRAYDEAQREMVEGPNREAYGKLQGILSEPGAIERIWGKEE